MTWGFERDYIWVNRGYRGVFELGDGVANAGERVTCSSAGRMRSCPAYTDRGVELVRQLSDASCRAEYSWGYDRGYIWVPRLPGRVPRGGGWTPIRRTDR